MRLSGARSDEREQFRKRRDHEDGHFELVQAAAGQALGVERLLLRMERNEDGVLDALATALTGECQHASFGYALLADLNG